MIGPEGDVGEGRTSFCPKRHCTVVGCIVCGQLTGYVHRIIQCFELEGPLKII